MQVVRLGREWIEDAARVLAEACAFDAAATVAEEKLFEPGPRSSRGAAATEATAPATLVTPEVFGARTSDGELVGVAAICARWIRVLAVAPGMRGRGAGSALLAACEDRARATGSTGVTMLAQPGNYLAPGIDERNLDTIAWLERRGFTRGTELRENLLVNVRGNPRVTPERVAAATEAARDRGYTVRRATTGDAGALTTTVADEFGGAWPYEVARALDRGGVFVAEREGAYCAFAAHDGNNAGLGWFGPAGTLPAHRGQGLGEALLLACLLDVAADHATCEIAWIGPRAFYERVAGPVATRRFVPMSKPLR